MLKKYFDEDLYENLKSNNDLLYKSLELITVLFKDKCDKEGIPYSNHLLKVYSGVSEYNEKIVALLHDVLEDTDVTSDDLKEFGYPDEIISCVKVLTKNKGEYYPDYIDRIIDSNNIHAMNVKLADLTHNMDSNRIKNPTVNDLDRITKRYMPAYNKIQAKLNEIKEK